MIPAWLVVGSLSGNVLAAVPRIVGSPAIDNPSFNGTANTMMYAVTVTVDGIAADSDHVAVVGFASDDDYTTCNGTTAWKWSHRQRFDTADTRSWTLYNFVPGTSYHYKVTLGTGASTRSRCGILETTAAPTPTLPANLAALNLQYAWGGASHPADTRYVLLETDDCGAGGTTNARQYVVVLDPEQETIVWYLDIAAASNVRGGSSTGYRYQPGTSDTSGRIVMTVDRRYVFEWAFDGTVINSHDYGASDECAGVSGSEGPCVHHDVFKSDDTGRTYVLASKRTTVDGTGTDWEASCGTDAYFVDDGFNILNARSDITAEHYVMTDYGYDPTVDPGPHSHEISSRAGACDADTWRTIFDPAWGTIDWTHANAIAASKYGSVEMVDVSIKEWNQIVRINSVTGDLVWRFSSESGESDFGTIGKAAGLAGAADFAGQHEVHPVGPDTLMMFDNHGASGTGARVIEVALDTTAWSATIEKIWSVVDGAARTLGCGIEGSGELVPDSADGHILADCPDKYVAVELDDPTGNTGTPPLAISLPDGTPDPFCTSGGPADRASIHGWQRAFPLAHVGEF